MASRRSSLRLFAALSIAFAATAGFAQSTVTLDATSGTGTIYTFYTTTGGLTLNNGFFADYLVVGGGGSGGTPGGQSSNQNNWSTGGGGGGGMLTGTSQQLSAMSYTVTVGGGGAAPAYVSGTTLQGNNGANSVFGSFTAVGGGGGGGGENSFGGVGANGGSGGGGGSKYSNAGGTGTTDQGNAGGAARNGDQSSAGGRTAAGGGGGAGGVGGTPATNSSNGGNGGLGLASTITGASVTYAGGGGGGAWDTFDSAETAGAGGSGGGGAGITSGTATAGTDGLGGGGGGSGVNGAGGRGGSGIVIVRYQGASLGNIGGTVTSGSGLAAGYTLHTFTTSGTTTATSALDLSGVDMNARLGVTLAAGISGSGGLTFAGPGRLTLAAGNTFTGDTRISSGTLAMGNFNALLNSTLDMNANDSGSVTFIPWTSYPMYNYIGGLKGSRDIDLGDSRLEIGGNNADTTYSGRFTGVGVVRKTGTGTLTLTGSSSFVGETRVDQGLLIVANATALANATLDTDHASSSGEYRFLQDSTLGGLKGSGLLSNGGHTLTIGGDNSSSRYEGLIDGSGGLTKTGNGTLTLAGGNYNGYTGLTWVKSGTLSGYAGGRYTAFNPSSDVRVDSGATLITVQNFFITNLRNNGTVEVNSGFDVTGTLSGTGAFSSNFGAFGVSGVHSPGNDSAGIQTFGGDEGLYYDVGAVVNWDLLGNSESNNSGVVFDQIVLSTGNVGFSASNLIALSFNGVGSQVDWSNDFWDVNRIWTIFDLESGAVNAGAYPTLSGSLLDSNGLALDASTRGYFRLIWSPRNILGQDVKLEFVAVPEPSTLVLGAVGIAGAAGLRRRRLRVKAP